MHLPSEEHTSCLAFIQTPILTNEYQEIMQMCLACDSYPHAKRVQLHHLQVINELGIALDPGEWHVDVQITVRRQVK